MPDDADELILKMQHLEAQARESERARSAGGSAAQLRTKAQQMAQEAQAEVDAAQKELDAGQAKLAKALEPGMPTLQAADLIVEGRRQAHEGKERLVKARARLNFALDRMDEAERRAWEALQADARADTHGALADDPAFKGPTER